MDLDETKKDLRHDAVRNGSFREIWRNKMDKHWPTPTHDTEKRRQNSTTPSITRFFRRTLKGIKRRNRFYGSGRNKKRFATWWFQNCDFGGLFGRLRWAKNNTGTRHRQQTTNFTTNAITIFLRQSVGGTKRRNGSMYMDGTKRDLRHDGFGIEIFGDLDDHNGQTTTPPHDKDKRRQNSTTPSMKHFFDIQWQE